MVFPKTKVKRCLVCSEGGSSVLTCLKLVRLVDYGSSSKSVVSQDLIFIWLVITTNV